MAESAPEIIVDPHAPEAAPPQETTEVIPSSDAPEPQPERTRAEERISELAQQVESQRGLLTAQQQMLQQLRGQAGTVPFQPKPEYESHEYTQYMDRRFAPVIQMLQAQNQTLLIQNDLHQSRSNVDDVFGSGTYRKYGKQVEDTFQAELAKGTPESREKIFYRLATEKGWKLTPQDEREEQQTRSTRKRAAQSATLSVVPPARRADSPAPEKPMTAMTKQERDAAFDSWIAKNGGF